MCDCKQKQSITITILTIILILYCCCLTAAPPPPATSLCSAPVATRKLWKRALLAAIPVCGMMMHADSAQMERQSNR